MAKHIVNGNNTDIWLEINRFRLEYNRDLQDEIAKNQIDHLLYQHEKFWYARWINALWVIYSWLSLASFAEPKDEKKSSLQRERRQKTWHNIPIEGRDFGTFHTNRWWN